MKRREAREIAFKLTYEMTVTGAFNPETAESLVSGADKDSREYIESVVDGIESHLNGLRALIAKYARGYEVDRIYKTDLAVLYLACYEILFTDTPNAVVVNEAVEITKAYSDSLSYSFVNGILASIIKAAENGEISAKDSDGQLEADGAENGASEDLAETNETSAVEEKVGSDDIDGAE